MKNKILLIALLLGALIAGVAKCNADVFLDGATIIGNPANHNEVVTFVLPLNENKESGLYTFGYRVWLNDYQMTVVTVEHAEDYYYTSCNSYIKDLSKQSGVTENECTINELSATLYYIPTQTLNLLNEYYK